MLDIPLGSSFGADRQIVHNDVSSRVLENSHYIISLPRRFGDDAREVLPQPIMCHAAVYLCIEFGNICKAIRIIWGSVNSLTDIFAHFILINVKSGSELDIVDVVASKIDMHQARNKILWLCLTIVMDALH